ncbi:MAG: G:T-mismatch repair DNA endonuclease (very short patch repair protein) [Akkermansiaceae bacterium]|jgi:G:T-mismatch repair DNA endonuclease (very short patch repair protein)
MFIPATQPRKPLRLRDSARDLPKSRTEWWKEKIGKTQERDARNESSLRDAGWSVLAVWECAFENLAAIERLEKRLIKDASLRLATKRAFPS